MSFFSNPFSSKRRREAHELELGTPEDIAPETPPTASQHHRLLKNQASSFSSADSSPASPLLSGSAQDTAIKVRDRAQYFESLIRSKATEESDEPGRENDGGSLALKNHPSSPSNRKTTGFTLNDNNEDLQQTFHHQQHQQRPQGALFGGLTAAAAADALQNLRLELTRVENERVAAVEALRRKTQEVDNLHSIVRELTESRAAALSARATLAEQFVDLRRAHERVARVADLSRTVSKENLELTKAARGVAAEAAKEAADAKREAAAAGKAESRAAEENAVLRQKINLLERRAWHEEKHGYQPLESVCRREFMHTIVETY